MNIQMQSLQFPLTEALGSHIQDRMIWAMQRFENQITYAKVRLIDLNGDNRKGVDKRCQLTLQFKGAGVIVSTGIDDDAYAAVSMAAKRMRKALARRKPNATLPVRERQARLKDLSSDSADQPYSWDAAPERMTKLLWNLQSDSFCTTRSDLTTISRAKRLRKRMRTSPQQSPVGVSER